MRLLAAFFLPPSLPLLRRLHPPAKSTQIVIFGSKNVPESDIRAALTEKVGEAYKPQAAEKDRAAVQALGTFTAATVAAAPDPAGGVDVTYTVTEYPLVTTIKFVADTPDKQPSVPAYQLLSQMTVKIGQVLNVNAFQRDLVSLFDLRMGYVAKQGYLFDVSTAINIESTTGVVTIPLVERRIQSITITGNSRVKTADIPGPNADTPRRHLFRARLSKKMNKPFMQWARSRSSRLEPGRKRGRALCASPSLWLSGKLRRLTI